MGVHQRDAVVQASCSELCAGRSGDATLVCRDWQEDAGPSRHGPHPCKAEGLAPGGHATARDLPMRLVRGGNGRIIAQIASESAYELLITARGGAAASGSQAAVARPASQRDPEPGQHRHTHGDCAAVAPAGAVLDQTHTTARCNWTPALAELPTWLAVSHQSEWTSLAAGLGRSRSRGARYGGAAYPTAPHGQ